MTPTPQGPLRPSQQPTEPRKPYDWYQCACGAHWGGLKTCHCTGCHRTFTTITAFDKHRTGSHANDTRRCRHPADVGLIRTNRTYECWGKAGARAWP